MSKQQFRDRCRQDKELCQAILEKYRTNNKYYWQDGWCEILELVPSKRHGYVQISANGFNKFAVLEEVVIWANGQEVKEGCDASHLCHRKLCCNLDHVVSEPKAKALEPVPQELSRMDTMSSLPFEDFYLPAFPFMYQVLYRLQ